MISMNKLMKIIEYIFTIKEKFTSILYSYYIIEIKFIIMYMYIIIINLIITIFHMN